MRRFLGALDALGKLSAIDLSSANEIVPTKIEALTNWTISLITQSYRRNDYDDKVANVFYDTSASVSCRSERHWISQITLSRNGNLKRKWKCSEERSPRI